MSEDELARIEEKCAHNDGETYMDGCFDLSDDCRALMAERAALVLDLGAALARALAAEARAERLDVALRATVVALSWVSESWMKAAADRGHGLPMCRTALEHARAAFAQSRDAATCATCKGERVVESSMRLPDELQEHVPCPTCAGKETGR